MAVMIGHLVLFSWPTVVFWLFSRLHPATALCWAIIGGYLLLPENISIDLPALPAIEKGSVAALSALAATAVLARPNSAQRNIAFSNITILPGLVPRNRVVVMLIMLMLVGIVGTVATNGDPIRFELRQLPGLRPYDAGSLLLSGFMTILPFLLARKYLASPEQQTRLLVALAIAGLIYSLPALYEVRMSPQISRMIYGYFPHDWIQHIRAGGFRPVVFLPHGLWLAIFFCTSFLATLFLWRLTTWPQSIGWLAATLWMLMTLVLAKGMGALAIGIMLGGVILFLPLRLRVVTAAVLTGMILVYPMLRGADLVPTERLVSLAASIDPDRAESLNFRLKNEDLLLAKANEQPLFGWGSWGRNRVYDERGADISVTDGYWVLAIGSGGWIGYLSAMGLLTLPLLLMALRWGRLCPTPATAGIALALTANLVDLIPNAALTPLTWLMAGALAGRLELGRLRSLDKNGDTKAAPSEGNGSLPPNSNPYTRQPHRHPIRSTGPHPPE